MAADMNGAESLVRTLLAGGGNDCFTNPGTSEMHFVAAQVYRWMNSLNQRPSLRRSGKPAGNHGADLAPILITSQPATAGT